MTEKLNGEILYEQLPLLSIDAIPEGAGFLIRRDHPESRNDRRKRTEFFTQHFIEALQDPGWVLSKEYLNSVQTEQGETCYETPLGRTVGQSSIDQLSQIAQDEDIEARANQFLRSFKGTGSEALDQALVMRTMELMATHSPEYNNLSFFRGGEFDSKDTFAGRDFATFDFENALMKYSHHSMHSVHDKPREKPVIITIPTLDIVDLFKKGQLNFLAPHNWYCEAIELKFNDRKAFLEKATVLRAGLPEEKERELIEQYRQTKAIDLS